MTFGFSTYKFEKIASKGDVLQSISVSKGTKSHVNLVFENDSGAIISKKNNSHNITHEIKINENISAPVKQNDVLGTINYYLDNELICSTNLVAEKDISKMNFINMFSHISETFVNLLR